MVYSLFYLYVTLNENIYDYENRYHLRRLVIT